jgi:two-component sensor histidine kinase
MTHQPTPPEFQRQLRSLFAIIRTLLRGTIEGRDSVEDYAAHLEGRIGALSRAHEMLMRAPTEGVDLQELLCGELLSQAIPQQRLSVEGPEIRICREFTSSLALAFHELMTNAISHGAFSVGDGRLEIVWRCATVDRLECLQLEWRESGMNLPGDEPLRKGFGYELIERMLPYELGATTAIQLARNGAQVDLLIPAAAVNPVWRPEKTNDCREPSHD